MRLFNLQAVLHDFHKSVKRRHTFGVVLKDCGAFQNSYASGVYIREYGVPRGFFVQSQPFVVGYLGYHCQML